jgi:hypothetical protein
MPKIWIREDCLPKKDEANPAAKTEPAKEQPKEENKKS